MSETDTAATGQVSSPAAEIYESFFVPALFGQWPDRILDTIGLSPDASVLDVGCGTGVFARAAADRANGPGLVTGVDINDGMLAVARGSDKSVDWQQGPAEQLPFPDDGFDAAVSQFALMFYADQSRGLQEMQRVVRPGGSVAVATWAEVAESPGYAAMVELLDRLFGPEAANALLAPFTIGTDAELRAIVDPVLSDATVVRLEGEARFDSIEAWVHTDVKGWTLADMIDDEQYGELLAAAQTELKRFVDDEGRVRFAAPALIAWATV